MNARILTVILLVVWLIIAWFTGSLLKLDGANLWLLRGLLALIGVIAAALVWWYLLRSAQSAGPVDITARTDDLALLLRVAEQKLRTSKLGRAARISSLPVVVFIGDRDAAKTSVIAQSGAEPELLAGQVYGDSVIVPTEAANCWFARGHVFIEVGGRLLGGATAFSQLIRSLKPQRLAFLKGAKNAARAAVICVPADVFLQPNASELTEGLARKFRAHLDEVASRLGIRLPVYVLFTKTDKVPFFTDYVQNFSDAEASEVIGATLPLDREQGAVVYAERATERIGDAYRNLVQALATHRTEALSREHNAARLGNVYEFPRELGKLRSAMVKFLVDVCRPSQLRTAPFLRGFYFAGVRPIVLDDRLDVMAAPAPQPSARDDVGATRIFRSGDLEAAREKPAPRAGGGRKVPQWTFVSHFFSDVLLKDAVAQGASGASVKTSALRRFALAGFALVLLIVAVGTTVSYFGNRGLENDVLGRVQAAAASAGSTKTLDTLTRLDSLRQSIDELREQEEKGAPFRLRWTLYSGRDVLAEGRKQYFKIFDRVLLDPAQDSMVSFLKGLPPSPGPASDYSGPYDTLKAYLITTSNHEQSTPMFLSPILLEQWSKNAGESAEITELAQKQFDFYATELKAANPLSAENDRDTIGNARRYLGQFDPVERVYRAMLAEATQKNPAIRLSTRYPKSAEVLVSNYEVSGAFTKGGFLSMSASLKNADRFFAGEEWVLGDRGAANVDAAKLEANLRTRYTTDFIQEWRAFLDKSAIARYADPADGARKLNQLAGNQSPLLGLLSIVSDNTSVDSEDIKKAFQPAQLVTPAGSAEKLIGESNGPYMGALLALQAALEQVANGPKGDGSDVLLAQAAAKASEAKVLTRQVAQNFRPDPERRIDAAVQKLLEDPISNAEGLVRSAGPGELNGKGRVFCGQIQDVMSKYPFTPTATKEATLQDLSSLFSPKDGALWSFYKSTLSKVLIKQGNQYVDDPSGSVRTTPAFREYWNRVAIFTDVMFPANAKQPQPQPKLAVTLKLVPNKSVNNVRLSIEGKNLSSNGSNPSPMVFTWTGSTQSVTLIAKMGNSPDLTFGRYDGFWGPFRFFADAEKWDIKGSTATFERILRQGAQGTPLTLQDGTPVSLKFELDSGASPIFHKGFMSGLRCVSEIARP